MQNDAVVQILLPLTLAFIMVGMGMSLVVDDFKRVLKYPKAVAIGLVGQLVVLPILGMAIASALPLSPEMAVGLVIIAACPGGVTSNLIAHMARGNTALSISLTAVSSVLTVFTIPLIINFGLITFMGNGTMISLPVGKTMLTLFFITLLPTVIGMSIRAKWPRFALSQERNVKIASGVFMGIMVIGLCVKERGILLNAIAQAGPATALLNISAMVLGYLIARAFRLNRADATSITVEVGIQNGTLAILIAGTLLNNAAMGIPGAIYSLVMFFNGGLLIAWNNTRRVPAAETAT